MVIKVSPDFAQSMIKKILVDMDIDAYMKNVGIWSKGSFDDHMLVVSKVLERLAQDEMECNLLKCKSAVQEASFLGHHMTPTGVTHMQNKIDAVLKMERPTNQTKVRSFIGAVTFYKSMWPRRSHVITPLHQLIGGGRSIWGQDKNRLFLL